MIVEGTVVLKPLNCFLNPFLQVVGKSMKERGKGGSIVNISSISSSKFQPPGIAMYSATKAALARITECAAMELGQYKVYFTYIYKKNNVFQFLKTMPNYNLCRKRNGPVLGALHFL